MCSPSFQVLEPYSTSCGTDDVRGGGRLESSKSMTDNEIEATRRHLVRSASLDYASDAAFPADRLRPREGHRVHPRRRDALGRVLRRLPHPQHAAGDHRRRRDVLGGHPRLHRGLGAAQRGRGARVRGARGRDVRAHPRGDHRGRNRGLAVARHAPGRPVPRNARQVRADGPPQPMDLPLHLPRFAGGAVSGAAQRAPPLRGGGGGADPPQRRDDRGRAVRGSPRLAEPTYGLAGGVLVGGLLQIAVQVPQLRRLHAVGRPALGWKDPVGALGAPPDGAPAPGLRHQRRQHGRVDAIRRRALRTAACRISTTRTA